MKKWRMIIDVAKCEDCNNCFLACKDEHVENEWKGYTKPQPIHDNRWINIHRTERGSYPIVDVAYQPTPCMHCNDAPCVKASDGAVYKRPDGIVMIDPEKSKGRKNISASCPYGAIFWNEEFDVPQKCTFCAHLMDSGWKAPRCVQACPTGALKIESVDDAEWNAIIASEGLEALKPKLNTLPNVYYKNLYRFNKCFVAGSVAVCKDGITDCIEGAAAVLIKDGNVVEKAATDNFGDFKIDGLDENSGKYIIRIEVPGYAPNEMELELSKSVNIGTIEF